MNSQVVNGTVLSNTCIAKGIYAMEIQSLPVAEGARCGQFVNVYMKDASTLLPRPISICEIKKESIVLVYAVVGKGTLEMSQYKPNDSIKVSTALGNGYTPQDTACAVLVGGGVGVPPLVQLAKTLTCPKIAVVGFRSEPFLIEALEATGAKVYIATDDGSHGFHGNVVELIQHYQLKGDYFYSCGPKPMLKALSQYCMEQAIPIQVSLEERMGCGYGACVGCVCKTKGEKETVSTYKKVCKDGPVFLGSEVEW